MAALGGPALPVSIPTALGGRVAFDLGAQELVLQDVSDPKASLHECASRYGAQAIRSVFEKLEEKGLASTYGTIDLSDNNVGDEGADWLLKGLTRKTPAGALVGRDLKRLIIPRARVGEAGMKALGGVIGGCPSLELAVLSANLCGAGGVVGDFCDGLSASRTLRSLSIAACRIGDIGVKALASGPLKSHPSLEHVSLQYNMLGPVAAKSLAAVLATNKTLQYLDICGNTVGAAGAQELAEGLKKNGGHLKRLGAAQNEMGPHGVKALSKHFLAPGCNQLAFLDLRHNAVPYHAMVKIRAELDRPMSGPEGWMLVFDDRQLLLNR